MDPSGALFCLRTAERRTGNHRSPDRPRSPDYRIASASLNQYAVITRSPVSKFSR